MGLITSYLERSGGMRAATPENPRFSLNDPAAWDALGSTEASSGVRVNSETALTYSPWWRGVNMISRDVGKISFFLYHRLGVQGEGRERAIKHPAYYLSLWKPNEFQTAMTFRQQLTGHALSTGNGYASISRTGDGTPVELLPLDPTVTTPVRANGQMKYVTHAAGDPIKLNAEDVLHIKGFGYDGLSGYNVAEKARESLGLGMGAQKYATIFFRNNARTPVVLECPMKLPDIQKDALRNSWERMHTGLDNAHRTAILDAGLQAKTIGFNAQDSQLIETRSFELREVANWLGIPGIKLGDASRTGYNSLESDSQNYLDDALDFWLCNWELESRDKLLTEEEKRQDTHFFEFRRIDLVRADAAGRARYFRTALAGAPWLAVNEVREEEGWNPAETKYDKILAPLNMGTQPERPPTPVDPPAHAQAHRAILADAVRRMVRRVGHQAERAAKEPKTFMAWIDTIVANNEDTVGEAFAFVLLVQAREGDPSGWFFESLKYALRELAGASTAKTLAADVGGLFARLDTELPALAVTTFLGDDHA